MLDGEGRVLLHLRAAERAWACPSGALRAGESLLAGLRRELEEETGLEVHRERLVGIYSEPGLQVVDRGGSPVHFVTCLLECRVASGRLRGSSEGLAWRWFARDALPDALAPYARPWLDDLFAGGPPVAR